MRSILIFCITIILISSTSGYTQRRKNTYKADKAFESGEYFEAAERYQKKYSKTRNRTQKGEIAFKIAECYRKLNEPRQMERYYRSAIRRKYKDPVAVLYYADALKMNEDYEEAVEQYQEYQKLVPDDPRGQRGLMACELIQEGMNTPTRHIVKPMDDFNSRANDFTPAFLEEKEIVFASMREGATGTKTNSITGQAWSDIFVVKMDNKGDWSTPVPVPGKVNTMFSETSPSITNGGKTMYFTSCRYVKNAAAGCRIYFSEKQGAEWSEPGEVKIVEDSSLTVADPAISVDENTLIFTSSMEGTYGGYDLWMIKRNARGRWGEPQNLGPEINTQGNERFPFLHADGTLYFASDGHVTIGGLDIFKAVKDDEGRWTVENMKVPINSPDDDFGIVFWKGEERGYFSTTRKGGDGEDDIWSFELPPLEFALEGKVEGAQSGEPLQEVKIRMLASDGKAFDAETGEDGTFKFDLDPKTDYMVVAEKENYLKGKGRETTKGLEEDKTLKMMIFMDPIDKPIELPNIEYDLNSAELRVESQVALDRLVETLNDNPITIELRAHTDYRASDEYNDKLSQARAQSVMDYLISKNVDSTRLQAKGYGEKRPKTISPKLAEQYEFLNEGDVLTEEFIKNLESEEQQEVCNQLNRRTEFQVLSTDYKKGGKAKKEVETKKEEVDDSR